MIIWEGVKIDKPVCFILFGHSLEEFDNRIQEFKDLDVLWFSLNWWEIAQEILNKINRKLDYVFLYNPASGSPCPHAHTLKGSEARGCTLHEAVYQFCENGVKEVYLFGADGMNVQNKGIPYYGLKAYNHTGHMRHEEDLNHFNANFPHQLVKDSGLQIYNTSQVSRYNLPKITLDECLIKLKTRQNQANTSL